jgi:hypothetical protein
MEANKSNKHSHKLLIFSRIQKNIRKWVLESEGGLYFMGLQEQGKHYWQERWLINQDVNL